MHKICTQTHFTHALQVCDSEPLIIGGDFNTPSHQVQHNKYVDINKCKCRIGLKTQPTCTNTNTSSGQQRRFSQMLDSRTASAKCMSTRLQMQVRVQTRQRISYLHLFEGNTYSPIHKYYDNGVPYPQDRIDYIFYKSSRLTPISSFVYLGNSDTPISRIMPDHQQNDWPSDHAAVVTDFRIN
jgi:hypothetical protein